MNPGGPKLGVGTPHSVSQFVLLVYHAHPCPREIIKRENDQLAPLFIAFLFHPRKVDWEVLRGVAQPKDRTRFIDEG
jgi:hypothetical protein